MTSDLQRLQEEKNNKGSVCHWYAAKFGLAMIQQHGCKRRVTFPLPEREEFPSLNPSDASCIHFAAYYWGFTQMSKDTLNNHEHKQGKVYQKTFSSVHVVRIWREELWGLVSIAGFSRSATWLWIYLGAAHSSISWEAVFSYIILKHYGFLKANKENRQRLFYILRD